MSRKPRPTRSSQPADERSLPDPGEASPAMPPAVASLDGGAAALSPMDLVSGIDAKVLVLNKMYMAVRIVSVRRAFSLLFRDLAEVVHIEDSGHYASYDFESWTEVSELSREIEPDKHEWVRTVTLAVAVPRVIRLHVYDRIPKQGVKLNRRNLFARDRNQCQYCGKHFPTSELSLDHVMPSCQGGGDTWTNLVCACVGCNSKKGGRTPEQANMKLIRPPKQPRSNPLIRVKLGSGRYESWKAFLDNAYWSVELR
ncbi:MAG: HNH endonuclease [Planctomycetota bacterium]